MKFRRGPAASPRDCQHSRPNLNHVDAPPTDARTLRRACEARINELELSEPFDVFALCAVVEQQRGRRLRILAKPADIVDAPCGLWLRTETEDIVFVDESTSELHQRHILLHEIGHLLCDHSRLSEPQGGFVAQFLPDLDPAVVQWTLSRHEYVEAQEREAELLATLLLARAQWAAPDPDHEGEGPMNTILQAFAGRRS